MRILALLFTLLAASLEDHRGFVVAGRGLRVDVESGRCVQAAASVRASRDGVGYRFDVVAPADPTGVVTVYARLERGVIRLWIGRTEPTLCMRRVVVRPRSVLEPVREIVVETRDGVVVREPVALGPYARH